ncbi:hypothetical protein E2542_SST21169 [Spatholobus suberectus]|nr:hypothetical protein E2542_SST21169 [Spatholobus suberectus]
MQPSHLKSSASTFRLCPQQELELTHLSTTLQAPNFNYLPSQVTLIRLTSPSTRHSPPTKPSQVYHTILLECEISSLLLIFNLISCTSTELFSFVLFFNLSLSEPHGH